MPPAASNEFVLQTGASYRFKLKQKSIAILEMEDVHFGHDSVVFLPGGIRVGDAAIDELSGLSVLRACFQYARSNPDCRMLVVGHTDTSGGDAYNLKLSDDRALNVLHLMRGDKASWVDLSLEHHQPKDVQATLKWASGLGWPTDPGPLDGILGSKSKEAIKEFQSVYNLLFEEEIDVDGIVGRQTFTAFFDLFERSLALSLHADPAELNARRSSLNLLESGHTGCGEAHPLDALGRDNYRSASNRRVEILFFGPAATVDLGADPTLDAIYKATDYRRHYLSELVIQGDKGQEPPTNFGVAAQATLRAVIIGPRLSGDYLWQCDSTKVELNAQESCLELTLMEKLEDDDVVEVTCELSAAGKNYQAKHQITSKLKFFVQAVDDDEEADGWLEAPIEIWERQSAEESA